MTIINQFSRTGLQGSAPSPKFPASSVPVVHQVSEGQEQTWSEFRSACEQFPFAPHASLIFSDAHCDEHSTSPDKSICLQAIFSHNFVPSTLTASQLLRSSAVLDGLSVWALNPRLVFKLSVAFTRDSKFLKDLEVSHDHSKVEKFKNNYRSRNNASWNTWPLVGKLFLKVAASKVSVKVTMTNDCLSIRTSNSRFLVLS